MAYSKADFSEKTLTATRIYIHEDVSNLVNHSKLGSQVMYVVLISICHEFIHLLVAYKYGKSLTPKLKEVEKFKVKTRYVCKRIKFFLLVLFKAYVYVYDQ